MSPKYSLSSVPEDQSVSFSSRQRKNHDPADTTTGVTREAVESMVRQIFPDDIDSADQLLEEFQGREDELLQSLWRMRDAANSDRPPSIGEYDESRRENDAIKGVGTRKIDATTGPLDLDQEDFDHQIACNLSNPQGGRGGGEWSDGDSFGSEDSGNKEHLKLPTNPDFSTVANSSRAEDNHRAEDEKMTPDYCDEDENNYIPTDYVVEKQSTKPPPRRTGPIIQNEYGAATSPTGKKTVALLKLRVWDPASPEGGQMIFLTSTHVLLPKEQDEEGHMSSRPELCVGTIVGIQSKTPSMILKSDASINDDATSCSYSLKRHHDWRVGNAVNVHKVNILPSSRLPELHYQIENHYSSLRELVMDGWPPEAVGPEEAELVLEAIGSNTSIKRLSMRYSNVTDDVASHCALALVKNTTLTQLTLEGNHLTNLSVQNFYSILKKNNATLRMLDLSQNPKIDDDVEQSLDQYMEQRAFKRTLTNKAEKAKRKARGLPPDATLEEFDAEGDGQVTVVCPQSIIDEVVAGGDRTDSNKHHSREQLQLNQSPAAELTDQSSYGSQNSSITSRSINRPGNGTEIVTTIPHAQPNKAGTKVHALPRKSIPTDGAVKKKLRQPQGQVNKEPGLEMSSSKKARKAGSPPANHDLSGSEGSHSSSSSDGSHSFSNQGSHSSLELSNDHSDAKAHERELRSKLAMEGKAVGATYVNEVAFARQNRAGRSRVRRTESQRRARLAELSGAAPATNAAADVAGNTSSATEQLIEADIERADEITEDMNQSKSRLQAICHGERIIFGIILLLAVALAVMVITLIVR